MNAYRGNRADTIRETVEADTVGTAILGLMGQLDVAARAVDWEGSCKDLKLELEKFTDEAVKKSRVWPQTPRALSSRVRRLVTFLRESGINITFLGRCSKGQRILRITRTVADSTATNATSATTDAVSPWDQSLAAQETGGDSSGATYEPPLQPPPTPSLPNQLNHCELKTGNGGGGESGGCQHSESARAELTSSDGPRD